MRVVRHVVLVCICAVLTGCVSRAGVAEFAAYKTVFDESAAVTTSIIDQLAAGEREIEQRVRLKPNSAGIDLTFRPGDANVFSNLADPPLAAQYRHALALVSRYNILMLGYATGQGFAQTDAELTELAREASATLGAIAGSAQIVGGLTPFLGALQEISSYALASRSRAIFRERALAYHDDIVGIIATMRDGSAEMFPNLTENLKIEILRAISAKQDTAQLRNKYQAVRVLLSDWVVMMDKNIEALNAVKVAIQNPSLGTQLSGLTAEKIELRSVTDGVRRHFAELNAR
jgi:hypothetical protein